METHEPAPAVTPPVVVLAILNALLFAAGALLHIGIGIGPIDEPASRPAMMLEVAGAIFLGLATMGVFTAASWARRLATFANTFALVAVVAVSMLLGLDEERSAAGLKFIQVLRVVCASASLLILYHSGQDRRAG